MEVHPCRIPRIVSTIIHNIPPRILYEAGFSGSVTVPNDVSNLAAWVQGAGGAGRQYYHAPTALDWDDGGGGGGFVHHEIPVQSSEWGTSITVTVGSAVASADGQASSVTGTLNGASFTLTGGGGKKAIGGTGGTASGGTINADGFAGEAANPGDSQPGAAGLPGGDGQEGIEPGGGGGLGVTLAQNGYVVLMWG